MPQTLCHFLTMVRAGSVGEPCALAQSAKPAQQSQSVTPIPHLIKPNNSTGILQVIQML